MAKEINSPQINPWFSIWTSPKKTLRALLDTDPQKVIVWLAILSGIVSAFVLTIYIWVRYPDRHSLVGSGALLIGGALLGLFHLYFGGWLYKLTGSWAGGKGSFTDVKCAIGWSNYPFLIGNLINIIAFLVIAHPLIYAICAVLNLVIVIWGFVIFVNLLGEAHGFSAWKGLLTLLLALLLIFVAFMLISLVIPLISPLFQ